MKKITLICLLIALSIGTKAQTFVTIPDAHFVTWLTANVPSAMVGSQMDTSNIEVTSLTSINVAGDSIHDLTGLQYFSSLQILECSNNAVDSLPPLPLSLQSLSCVYDHLTRLPTLPNTITYLNCFQNYLDSLPVLPTSLVSLDCGNNSLTSLPVLPSTLITFSCSGNQLDSLPTLPLVLSSLTCSENQLTFLPALPTSLHTLICEHNHLLSLPTLPDSLQTLNCGYDSLTSLPTLPIALTDLECYYNQLTSLPTLPNFLQTLVCGGNLLTSLPTLPASLLSLTCYLNQLTTLPVLPDSLNYIDCHGNVITILPALDISLVTLDCSSNLLTTLPSLNDALVHLNCSSNQLSVFPAFSVSLYDVNCSNNLLTTMPAFSIGLNTLDCSFNHITTIPTMAGNLHDLSCNNNLLPTLSTLPGSLNMLNCGYNPMIDLPTLPSSLSTLNCTASTLDSLPALPASLTYLECDNNNLIGLPTLPTALYYLNCDYNMITNLPTIPASLMQLSCYHNAINCFEIFPFSITSLNIYNNPFTCLPNYIPAMDSVILSYPLCVAGDFVNNPHGCDGAQGIVGFTYTDVDSNCVKDSTDFQLINIPVKVYDGAGALVSQTYTASNGIYDFPQPAGIYTVVIDTLGLPISPQCAAPGIDSTVSITLADPLIQNVNFDFNCKPGFDIGVQSVLTQGFVFPGETHQLRILAGDMTQWYHMHCAAGLSGQVEVIVAGPVTYNGPLAGALVPTVVGSVYTYSISDFGTINNATAFGLSFTTDTTAGSGSPICVTIHVTPVGGDNDTTNNEYAFCYTVVNSHDPNTKETYPEVVEPLFQDWFTYTIHFQNTGTAPAMNVHIEDTLDNNLDLNTFQVINYSHANTTVLNGNNLTVRFPDINLPDSLSSPDSSKAYIQYRIKPKAARPSGTQIHNTAFIYFDYNEAVVTNTTTNVFRPSFTSVNEHSNDQSISIYPNPANDRISISYNGLSKNATIEIYNVTGQLVKGVKTNSPNKLVIDVSDLMTGLYVLKIQDGNGIATKKFLKN